MVFLLGFEAHFSRALLYSVLVRLNSKTPVPCGGRGTVKLQFRGLKALPPFFHMLRFWNVLLLKNSLRLEREEGGLVSSMRCSWKGPGQALAPTSYNLLQLQPLGSYSVFHPVGTCTQCAQIYIQAWN